MKNRLLRIMGLITLSACILAGSAGCGQTAKKPAPAKKPSTSYQTPTTTPAKKPVTTSITKAEAKRIADRLARDAAKVKGVNKASVVVDNTGTRPNAYVGLDLKTNVRGNETNKVKMDVEKKLKAAEPRLKSVNVTSDPDLVKRIKDIAMGISKGKPLSSFSTELKEVGRRIVPTTR